MRLSKWFTLVIFHHVHFSEKNGNVFHRPTFKIRVKLQIHLKTEHVLCTETFDYSALSVNIFCKVTLTS